MRSIVVIDLDNIQSLRQQDPQRMLDRISELPDQLRDSWRAVAGFSLPSDYTAVDNVIIMGMGGSAIGGDLVRTLVAGEARAPIEIVRDYNIPAYVGPRTLAIASSYSGNTEESLSGFAQALAKGAKVLAATTGGELLARCREHGLPVFQFAYNSQPRAALGHSLVPLLGILGKAGIIGDKADDVAEAAGLLDSLKARLGPTSPTATNPAKLLAQDLRGRLPVVYGAGLTAEVARRWKGQFNENAKAFAAFDAFPELNHNSVVGYEFPESLSESIRVIFLTPKQVHPRVAARFSVTQELLRRRGVKFHTVESEGEGALAQVMSAVYVGDWTSYYLAALNGIDPTPVKAIDFLKEQIAKG
jgi:glucose/mannose-6-phosphate isomerase